MRKIIFFCNIINLTTVAISLVACDNPNNSIKTNTKVEFKPIVPPKSSKWELVSDGKVKPNTGWYFWIQYNFQVTKNVNRTYFIDSSDRYWLTPSGRGDYDNNINNNLSNILYHWTGTSKPNKPTIDMETGQVTNWNENLK